MLLRFQDRAKIFWDPRFLRNHSIPLLVISYPFPNSFILSWIIQGCHTSLTSMHCLKSWFISSRLHGRWSVNRILYLRLILLVHQCSASIKKWLPNTNFNNPANWDKRRVPFDGEDVKLDKVLNVLVNSMHLSHTYFNFSTLFTLQTCLIYFWGVLPYISYIGMCHPIG